ncbi:MAG: isoprenylcysteine carboxylmethyltransferase family protein [Planctomycetes bacterium]|nr:isoprenylcysteine carboxylmethyltransferase family protein [Planctomycetota bacterium]
MSLLTDAWFWAFVAMFGLQCATFVVSGHRLGRNLAFTALALTAVTIGRFLLVLPFCPQPRFDISIWNWIIGGIVLLAAGAIGIPTLSIKWWRAPDPQMRLRTSWPYSIVRHPMYLSELLWPIGWSIWWGSIYGLALTPICWIGLLLHVLTEEKQLEEKLGSQYDDYKKQVPGRIFPRLPI